MNNVTPFNRLINDVSNPVDIAASLDLVSHQLVMFSIRNGEATDSNLLQNLETLRVLRNAALQSGDCVLMPLDPA